MATLDEGIAQIQARLDQLRNRDFVPEQKRQAYYNAIVDAEKELLDLLRLKEEQ